MIPHCTIREVERLNGRINALSRFISQTVDKCKSFFSVTENCYEGNITWMTECEEAFGKLKTFLASLPMLISAKEGEDLFLYVATPEEAVSVVVNYRTK